MFRPNDQNFGYGGDSNGRSINDLPDDCFDEDGMSGYVVGRLKRFPNGSTATALEGFVFWNDAKEVLKNTCDPVTALNRNTSGSKFHVSSIPTHVEFASNFVKHCNKVTEPIVTHNTGFMGEGSSMEVHAPPELSPKQDQVMTLACEAIGKYLAQCSAKMVDGKLPEPPKDV